MLVAGDKPGRKMLRGGDGFVEIGEWRIGDLDGYFAICHSSSTQANVLFSSETGVMDPVSGPAEGLWAKAGGSVSRVDMGDGLLQFASQWRLGDVEDAYITLSHSNGRILMAWHKSGADIEGPALNQSKFSTWQRTMKTKDVAIGDRFVELGKSWRIGDTDGTVMTITYAPNTTVAVVTDDGMVAGSSITPTGPPPAWMVHDRPQDRPMQAMIAGAVLHAVANCSECGVPWCNRNFAIEGAEVEKDYTVGSTLDKWGCTHVSANTMQVKNTDTDTMYAVEPRNGDWLCNLIKPCNLTMMCLAVMESACTWGAPQNGRSSGPALATYLGISSFENCQLLCCHSPGCRAVSYMYAAPPVATATPTASPTDGPGGQTPTPNTCVLLQQQYELHYEMSGGWKAANLVARTPGHDLDHAFPCVLILCAYLYRSHRLAMGSRPLLSSR